MLDDSAHSQGRTRYGPSAFPPEQRSEIARSGALARMVARRTAMAATPQGGAASGVLRIGDEHSMRRPG